MRYTVSSHLKALIVVLMLVFSVGIYSHRLPVCRNTVYTVVVLNRTSSSSRVVDTVVDRRLSFFHVLVTTCMFIGHPTQ